MYGLDNASGVNTMPALAPVSSPTPLWFTEGGAGLAASYPGQDWYNMVQAELLGVLTAGGIKPEKGKLNQLTEAIKKIVNSADFQPPGNYATTQALNNGLDKKFDKTGGSLAGPITAKYTVTAVGDDVGALAAQFNFIDGKPTVRAKLGNNWFNSYLPQKNGTIAHIGDSGIGIKIPPRFTNAEIPNLMTGQHFLQWGGEEDSAFAAFGGGTIINYYDTIGFGLFFRGFNGGACNFTVNKGVITRYDIYNTANTDADRNGNLKLKGSSELSDCQVGVPLPWPQATAPAGYLICNGQSFNKTSYPLLAEAYPSGVLPDLRGEFIRGLDAGRNVDSGRAALSAQSDAIRDITGEIQGINLSGNGVFGGGSVVAYAMSPNGSGKDQFKLNFKTSNVVPTANENRPRNIAFLYIVRAA